MFKPFHVTFHYCISVVSLISMPSDDESRLVSHNIRSCRLRAFALPGLRANAANSFLGCLRAQYLCFCILDFISHILSVQFLLFAHVVSVMDKMQLLNHRFATQRQFYLN
ncbi:hypothetical protein ABZP36_003828 [Zizania latifolia]